MDNILYRYFFPNWLFKDSNKGTMLEIAAAVRHNAEQAPHLLTYSRRWFMLSAVLYGTGYFVILPIITSTLLTFAVCAFAMSIMILSVWLRLIVKNPS